MPARIVIDGTNQIRLIFREMINQGFRYDPRKSFMNKHLNCIRPDEPRLTTGDAAAPPPDCLGKARAALDEAVAEAHEVGDWYALRVLHSVTALLAATRH
jgi:hypothetical protein